MKKEQKSQESIYNNKGVSALYRILYFILPYSIYTKKLPLSLKDDSATPKTKTSWWTKLTEKIFKKREPINYNFNMKDFFTLEHRIEENRQRIREFYDQYKRTENKYPIFLAYITAVGYWYFNFIAIIYNKLDTSFFTVITVLTGLSIIYTLYLIWEFFKDSPWRHDFLPKGVYEDYHPDVIKEKPELKPDSEVFNDDILQRYCNDLERFVKIDYDLYKNKKIKLSRIWKPMIISLVLLSINISIYKSIVMENKLKKVIIEAPEEIIVGEDKNTEKGEKTILIDQKKLENKTSIDFNDSSILNDPELLKVKDLQKRVDEIKK